MKLGDLTELASQNLREALLRNSLTTVGIAVGVASLVAMLSLGVGLQELINRRLESNGLFNTVLVRPQTSFNANGQMQRNRDSGATANRQWRSERRRRPQFRYCHQASGRNHPPAARHSFPTSSTSIPNFASPAICVSARPVI